MTLSITTLWEESIDFIRRELHLLVPLSFATLAIGDAAVSLASPEMKIGGTAGPDGLLMLASLGGLLLTMIGQLAITALTLSGGMSVGEALRKGLSCIPKLLLFGIVFGLAAMVMVIPLVIALQNAGYSPVTPANLWPSWAMLYVLGLIALLLWFGTRFMVFSTLVVDKNPPLFAAIKQAFAMTRGHFTRIIAAVLIYMLVYIVTTTAAGMVIGSLFGFIGKLLGTPFLGSVMAALGSGMVAAALGMVSAVFVTKLYQQLVRTV
jgi:hypothetical protein